MRSQGTWVIALEGGLASAALSLLHLLPIPGLNYLSLFASLPFFLVGLGVGARPLYGAVLISSCLIFILENPYTAAEHFFLLGLGSIFIVNRALLNKKTSEKKRTWYPGSYLLKDLILVTGFVMLLGITAYLYITQQMDIPTLIHTFLETIDPHKKIREIEPLLVQLFPLLPGLFAFSWSLLMVMNGSIAQGLLVRFKHNLRPSPSLETLEAPKHFAVILGLSLLLSFVGLGSLSLLGKNATIVLSFPFFLIGLGLIHHWARTTSYATLFLTLIYLSFFLLIWTAFLVILLGLLKPVLKIYLTHDKF